MQYISKKRLCFVMLALGSLTLSACAPIILGGAAMGVSMVADRRTAGAQLEDQRIELKMGSIVRGTPSLAKGRINTMSYNRIVLLIGEVPTENAKNLAQQAASSIQNVQSVINELAVAPNASFGQISSDTLLTAKVKATVLNNKDLYSTSFNFSSERGIVYLMGRVTAKEARLAVNLISRIDGVKKVVNALQIVDAGELKNMITAQPDKNIPAQ